MNFIDLFFFCLLLLAQHFMRTGTCQFGASCKYHHPRQGGASVAPVSLSYMGYPLRSVCVLIFSKLVFDFLYCMFSYKLL